MNGLVHNAFNALTSRYRGELEQASGQTLEQINASVQNRDEKGLCWLQKRAEEIRQRNPQLYAQMQRMAGGRNPFPGSR